jgi:hypothetical protein
MPKQSKTPRIRSKTKTKRFPSPEVIGIIIGVLSCLASWLALPQMQAFLSDTSTPIQSSPPASTPLLFTSQTLQASPSSQISTRSPVATAFEPPVGELVISSFPAPGKTITGITWDGTFLWLLDYEGTLFKVNTIGQPLASYSISDRPLGLAWDGEQFWMFRSLIVGPPWDVIETFQPDNTNITPSMTHEFSVRKNGGTQNVDLEWSSNGLWYSDPSQYQVYQLNSQVEILKSFIVAKPIMGLAWDGDFLWLAHQVDPFVTSTLSRVDIDGKENLVVTTPIISIEGLTWGENVLWAIGHDEFAGPLHIYQLDLDAVTNK